MLIFPLLIPIIASCFIAFFAAPEEEIYSELGIFLLISESLIILLYAAFLKFHLQTPEFQGSLVVKIVHEEEWVKIERRKTKSGIRTSYTHIPDKYYMYTSNQNNKFDINRKFYKHVKHLWDVKEKRNTICSSSIKGGIRFIYSCSMSEFSKSEQQNPKYWVPISEKHYYQNKIIRSNSILKYKKISNKEAAELGLYQYPETDQFFDAPCILSWNSHYEVSGKVDMLFRKFNAAFAPMSQMRLYILLFDETQSPAVSEQQRAYWQGGNKNEFIICIGISPDGVVKWARAFSWADVQQKEIEATHWLKRHPNLNWQEFHDWLVFHIEGWKRKEFSDFDYINATPSTGYYVLLIVLAAIGCGTYANEKIKHSLSMRAALPATEYRAKSLESPPEPVSNPERSQPDDNNDNGYSRFYDNRPPLDSDTLKNKTSHSSEHASHSYEYEYVYESN